MGTMARMDGSGDTKIIWDAENAAEVDAARRTFDDLLEKGYTAFSVRETGKKGTQIRQFDRHAEKLILIPAVQGG